MILGMIIGIERHFQNQMIINLENIKNKKHKLSIASQQKKNGIIVINNEILI